jgi:CDP-paratose 2-epimerase
MKMFVTGGLGVIGYSFCRQMAAVGHTITVLDACEKKRNEWAAAELEPLGVKVRRERMEHADLSEACESDLILHAAAFTGIPSSAGSPEDDWTSNVETTRNLLSHLMRAKVAPPTVVLSSVKPYSLARAKTSVTAGSRGLPRHSWEHGVGVDESWTLDPDEPYAASKMAQSALCVAYARTYGLPVMVFRCSNLYGAAPCHGPRHGWLTWFCISTAIGRPVTVQGDGMQSRDMLFSDDVTAAVMAAAGQMDEVRGKLFNIGGGAPNVVSVGEAAVMMQDRGAKLIKADGRRFEDLAFVTDHSSFTKVTGWRPQVSVDEGVERIFAWATENRESMIKIYDGS